MNMTRTRVMRPHTMEHRGLPANQQTLGQRHGTASFGVRGGNEPCSWLLDSEPLVCTDVRQ